MFVTVDKH